METGGRGVVIAALLSPKQGHAIRRMETQEGQDFDVADGEVSETRSRHKAYGNISAVAMSSSPIPEVRNKVTP